MRSLNIRCKFVAACTLSLAGPAAAQQARVYDFGRARTVIDSVMRASAIPSVAVAVAKGGAILWEAGTGFSDLERRIPATAHTPYSLASISKPFTATGIMLLVQQELVRLRSPVNHYLGGTRVTAREGSADGVTLERLLTHTAGLPLHYQFFYEDGGYARPPMDSTIRRYGVAVYPPGDAYQYSNLGFGLLDYVIARKSGLSYAEFMRRHVFAPLALTSTSVGAPSGPASRAAQRYDEDNKPIPYYTFDHVGASEIYSSARDLVRFGMFHLGARLPGQRPILPRETLRDMQRDVAVEGPGATRGLGWAIRSVFGVRRISHSGGMPGVSTFLALYPEEQVVIAVLLNKSVRAATEAIVAELSSIMLPRVAAGLRAARVAGDSVHPAADSLPAALRGEWRGFIHTYAESVTVTLTLGAGGASRLSVLGAPPAAVAGVAFGQGAVNATSDVQLASPDLARHPHRIALWLRPRDNKLTGYAAAVTRTPRAHYALSSYVRLERVTPND